MKELKSVDSGLVGLYLQSMARSRTQLNGGVGWGTKEEGRKPRQSDSGILSDCLEQSVSNISM